jgi:hypothetical protein
MKQQRRADIPQFRASGRDRLNRLAEFLDNVPAGMLTFTRWYGDGHGCAVGLAAAQDPWFKAQGLTLAGDGTLKECRPAYDGLSEWPAVAEFFDITIAEALDFFTAGGYGGDVRPPASDIAQKVRAHLATAKAETVTA